MSSLNVYKKECLVFHEFNEFESRKHIYPVTGLVV